MNRFTKTTENLPGPCRVATTHVSRGFQPTGIEYNEGTSRSDRSFTTSRSDRSFNTSRSDRSFNRD